MNLSVTVGPSAPAGTLAWMSGADSEVVNSFAEPRRVGVQEKAVELDGGTAVLELPPWSVSVFSVARS